MRSAIVQSVVSIFLLGAFGAPVVIPAIHAALEDHAHDSCDVSDGIHRHNESNDCSLCDYLISLQTFHQEDEQEHIGSPAPGVVAIQDQGQFSKGLLSSTPVRGPPAIG